MITEETYKEMRRLCHIYETNAFPLSGPYLIEFKVEEERKYNREYGDDKVCRCGHPYYRHFDTYEDMDPVGCKYCGCDEFKPEPSEMVKKFQEYLDNMTEEEVEEMRAKYFPPDTRPKGWISIEDSLPQMMAMDIFQGGTMYKVKYADGEENFSMVSDHNTWYYMAKEEGITHWWNE